MAEPYSDSWLRERGASFNPLTGKRVPPLQKERSQEGTVVSAKMESAQPEAPGQEEPKIEAAATGIPQTATKSTSSKDSLPNKGSVTVPGSEAPSPTTGTGEPPVPKKKGSRLSLIIGILLAIAAVLAAEHYLVPVFTHDRTKEAAGTLPPQSSQVLHVVTPTSSKVTKPSITAAASTPQSSVPHVNQSTTPVPSTNAQASVTPVQRTEAPMPRAEQTIPRSTPSATPQIQRPVPPSQPAAIPSPQERESKAQYEQQHMQQLLSPLG